MQHLDNNMDELFRKAAEDYPLKINIEDWDDIAPPEAVAVPQTINDEKRRLSFTSMLLLLFSLVAVLIAGLQLLNFNTTKKSIIVQKDATLSAIDSASKITGQSTAAAIQKATVKTDEPAQQKQLVNRFKKNNFPVGPNKKNNTSNNIKKEDGKNNRAGARIVFSLYSFEPVAAAIVCPPFLKEKMNLSQPSKKTSGTATNPVNKSVKKASRFYFGLEGGLQLNEVKGQGFNKTGLSAGIIAGFNLTRKLSVETGITWSQKHFYTDGKYFDMSKAIASMPSNMQVMNMTSSSNLLEIPLKVKYSIVQKRLSGWFVTAGISSYILTKESNSYLAVINGQEQNTGGKYMAQRNYFSAVAQMGVGYEYKASKNIKLRIEPYIQIPLKGIGIGEVQVMTAGLHFAVLK